MLNIFPISEILGFILQIVDKAKQHVANFFNNISS